MGKLDLYRCEICGNLVQTIIAGNGELVCCGQPMQKLERKQHEESIMEKHVPIFIKTDDNNTEIRVGEILHPMTEEHYIMFIEAINKSNNEIYLKYLYPNEEPKMQINKDFNVNKALEYCNIHGLWEGNNND